MAVTVAQRYLYNSFYMLSNFIILFDRGNWRLEQITRRRAFNLGVNFTFSLWSLCGKLGCHSKRTSFLQNTLRSLFESILCYRFHVSFGR